MNNNYWMILLFCLGLLCVGVNSFADAVPFSQTEKNMKSILKYRERAREGASFMIPNPAEVHTAEEMFRLLLMLSPTSPKVKEAVDALGFSVTSFLNGSELIYIVMEKEGCRKGRGFFLVREKGDIPVLLEAPHAGDDALTGNIVISLFLEHNVKAVAMNVVSRSQVDLAHVPVSYFQAVSLAFAKIYPRGIILQVHGFDMGKRNPDAPKDSHIIVTNGTRSPGQMLYTLCKSLKTALKISALLYPVDTKQLGATRNAQANLLSREGFSGFIHIEISKEWREKLSVNAPLRALFFKSIPFLSPEVQPPLSG